ncbi:I'm not dead yet-like, partial [Asbolus verrucosus]
MGGYWVFEVLPYAVTALIPLVLFPLMGVLDTKVTSMQYMKDSNMMFIGGLIIALAVEYCNLHTRISLHAIKLIGCSYRRLNFGLVTLTMLISMWISNTAATAMMTPIIEAVLMQLEEQGMSKMFEESENPEAEKEDPSLRKPTRATMCFYISTAYAATIGGLGCIVGSGTNLVFKGIYETHFKEGEGVDFNKWLGANIPLMLLIMYPSWIWIQIWYMGLCRPNSKDAKEINVGKEGEEITRKVLVGKLEEMGKCSTHEILVGIMFVIVVLLWFFRRPGFMPGWPKLITEMA